MSLQLWYVEASPLDPGAPYWVEIAFNWSSEEWRNPDQPPIPPLTPQEEDAYIRRQIIVPGELRTEPFAPGELGPYLLEILEYNPVWVSIDIRGYNVVLEATLSHECLEDLEPPPAIKFSPAPC